VRAASKGIEEGRMGEGREGEGAHHGGNGVGFAPVILCEGSHKVQALQGGVTPSLDVKVGCAEGRVHCFHK
jgi:hypothetical protein